jgi:hypothetical protein
MKKNAAVKVVSSFAENNSGLVQEPGWFFAKLRLAYKSRRFGVFFAKIRQICRFLAEVVQ